MTKSVNSIFISDIHAGFKYSRCDRAASFLRGYSCKNLFLLGDIIECWGFPHKFRINQAMLDFFSEVLRMKQEGTHVVYLPGNHDVAFKGQSVYGIEICSEYIHITDKYDTVLLLHGDIFDLPLQARIPPIIYKIGDFSYYVSILLNKWTNRFRKLLGLKYFSISHYLKTKVKNAVAYLSDFETMIAEYARNKKCNVVVVGHVHVHKDKMIDEIRYINTGSFMDSEGETALIEHLDGRLELYHKGEE